MFLTLKYTILYYLLEKNILFVIFLLFLFLFKQNMSIYIINITSLTILLFWNVSVTNANGSNIALGKHASMRETYGSYDARKAVDGVTDNNMFHGHCSHTSDQVIWHWWQVDLGNVYSVTSVRIANRGDCCQERLANFTIELSVQDPATLPGFPALTNRSSVCYHQPTSFPIDPPTTFQCNSPVCGRYLRLVQFNQFSLCEVEVYGDLVVTTSTPTATPTMTLTATELPRQGIITGKWECYDENQIKCSRRLSEAGVQKTILKCARKCLLERRTEDTTFMQISISLEKCQFLASLNDTSSNMDLITYIYT